MNKFHQAFRRELPFAMTPEQKSAVSALARKLRVKFWCLGQNNPTCYFEISYRVKDGVDNRREKLLDAIMEKNLGDSRGVFSGAPWFYADFLIENVSIEAFREVLYAKRPKLHLQLCELDQPISNHLCCEHSLNRLAYIDLFFQDDGTCRIKTSCETSPERRMVVSYFSGFIADHFSKRLNGFKVKLYQRAFEGIGVAR